VASGGASGGDVLESFQAAGRTLFSLGLVRGTEGNLSSFDGRTLWITRPEAPLNELTGGASGEREAGGIVLRRIQRRRRPSFGLSRAGSGGRGPRPPSGDRPGRPRRPGEHGIYVFGPTLPEAAEDAVRQARAIEGLDR
jgi:hypothetical protein